MIDVDFLFAIATTIYLVLIADLANWWWNWEHRPDCYPKNFFVHLLIWASICSLPFLIRILLKG
jgi:hypothetical protein